MVKGNTIRKKSYNAGYVLANILDYFFICINSLLNLTIHFCFLLSIFLPLSAKRGCHTVNGLRLYPHEPDAGNAAVGKNRLGFFPPFVCKNENKYDVSLSSGTDYCRFRQWWWCRNTSGSENIFGFRSLRNLCHHIDHSPKHTGSKRHTRSFSRNRRRANSCRIRRLNRRCR